MKEKKRESWFSGDEGAAAPHTIPVPLGPSPAAGAWGQRTDRVSGGRGVSPGTGKGQRPSCGPSCPLWDQSLFIPPPKRMRTGWLSSSPRGVWTRCVGARVLGAHVCAHASLCVGVAAGPGALPVCICHQGQPPIVPGHLPEDREQEQQCLRKERVVGRRRGRSPPGLAGTAGQRGRIFVLERDDSGWGEWSEARLGLGDGHSLLQSCLGSQGQVGEWLELQVLASDVQGVSAKGGGWHVGTHKEAHEVQSQHGGDAPERQALQDGAADAGTVAVVLGIAVVEGCGAQCGQQEGQHGCYCRMVLLGRGQSSQLGSAPVPLTVLVMAPAGWAWAGDSEGRSPGCLGGWKLWPLEIRAWGGEG